MTWRCLIIQSNGTVVQTEYFGTQADADLHAVQHSAEGFLCVVRQGTLAADGTFTPVVS